MERNKVEGNARVRDLYRNLRRTNGTGTKQIYREEKFERNTAKTQKDASLLITYEV